MTEPALTLRALSAADVVAAMPPVEERLALAERTMAALGNAAQLPPKFGVHPRPEASLADAMPAWLDGGTPDGGAQEGRVPDGGGPDGTADLLGLKWVTAFPSNTRLGVPAIHAVIILNDGSTGAPIGILDGAPVTAQRTAAVSGVALRHLAGPAGVPARPRVALLGGGVQGRSHVPVIAATLPGAGLTILDRHPERADELIRLATDAGLRDAATATDLRTAVRGADVVVSTLSFAAAHQLLGATVLRDVRLIVAVDYDMLVDGALATERAASGAFLVDDRGQFLAKRDGGGFAGYPAPSATLGELLRGEVAAPEGPTLVTHLGVGLADVIFGSAILARAAEAGLGTLLPR